MKAKRSFGLLSSIPLVVFLAMSPVAFPELPGLHGRAGAAASDPDAITVWHWYSDPAPLEALTAAFEAANPSIEVALQYLPWDELLGEYMAAVAAGGGPTVGLIGGSESVWELMDAGAVDDVTGLADPDLLATIVPTALAGVRHRGALVGLPYGLKGVVLYRNPEIIAAAQPTYEDLVAAAQAATGGDILGAVLERGFFFSAAHLEAMGGRLMYDSGCPAFNDATGLGWVELLESFSEAGPAVYYSDEDVDQFKMGQVGYIIDGTWNLGALREAVGDEDLAIDPWPAPLSGYVQTQNVYLNPNAEDPEREAGWKFMEFMLSAEAQTILLDSGNVPVIAGVPILDPLLQQAFGALASGTPFPVIPELNAYWASMDVALTSVFDGGADPAQALQDAYDAIVAALAGQGLTCAPGSVDVTLWHYWPDPEAGVLAQVVAAFQADHPEVVVHLYHVPLDELRTHYEAAVAAGSGPTVLIGASDWGPPFWDEGLVVDLTGLADPELLATILPAALAPVQYDGALIGLPHTTKGVVLYRNPDIIADAQPTYEDLVAAAQAATGGDILGAVLERGFFFSAAHLEGMGGRLMYDSGCPAFNDTTGVEWVELLDSFSEAGPAVYYTEDDLFQFKSGKVGYIIDGTWNLEGLRDAVGDEHLAIDPWPTPLSGYVQVENLYLNPNAVEPDRTGGLQFMEFMLSAGAQTLLLEAGHIPVVTGVPITDPFLQQAVDAFAGATAFPVVPEMGAYWGPMDTALPAVFDGGADPAGALREAYLAVAEAVEAIHPGLVCLHRVYGPLIFRNR